ncbi:hypothetical protein [Enterocloster citroniae]|uniref:hypothetical protein n=1 Tax=Enterocloster citroniae TaxID=358743 RepID=UPI0034A46CFF
MTQEQVICMVEEIGLPFAYDHFAEGQSPEPPFLVFIFPESRNFAADGIAYYKKNKLHLELYTEYKSVELEGQIEAVLERHGIFYGKSEAWIESERLYEVLYGMEV